MEKVKIGNIEFEVSPQIRQAIENERNDAANKLREMTSLKETEKGRADSLDTKVTDLTKKHTDATDPVALRKMITGRVNLETTARQFLPADTKFDTMDDRALRVAVLAKIEPAYKHDAAHSADYVTARYDGAVTVAERDNPSLRAARQATEGSHMDTDPAAGQRQDRTDPNQPRRDWITDPKVKARRDGMDPEAAENDARMDMMTWLKDLPVKPFSAGATKAQAAAGEIK